MLFRSRFHGDIHCGSHVMPARSLIEHHLVPALEAQVHDLGLGDRVITAITAENPRALASANRTRSA